MSDEKKLHRVYVTISIPLTLDVHADDGEGAWAVIETPQNRMTIARRLQEVAPDDLAIVMELKGFVEELDRVSAVTPPVGTVYATAEEQGGRVITPGTEGWEQWIEGKR